MRPSASRITRKCLKCFDVHTRCKDLESFLVQHPSRANHERRNRRGYYTCTSSTDWRTPVLTHLISRVSRGRLAWSPHDPDEDGLGLVRRSLIRVEFESGPHMYSFDWDRLACRCLLDVHLNTFTHHGSDTILEPQVGHHLHIKISLISFSQVPIELVHVIILDLILEKWIALRLGRPRSLPR